MKSVLTYAWFGAVFWNLAFSPASAGSPLCEWEFQEQKIHPSFVAWLKSAENSGTFPTGYTVGQGLTDRAAKVLVIGAGAAGLSAMAALQDAGIAFEAVERAARVGGVWDTENPWSPAYDSLSSNTSSSTSRIGPNAMPGLDLNMNVQDAQRRLENFMETRVLRRHIRFGVTVTSIAKGRHGEWLVNGTPYKAVILATGKHSKDQASIPEELVSSMREAGIQDIIHASHYRNPAPYKGKRVLVVGMGNTAADIATELSRHGVQTFLYARKTPWIVPLKIFGIPADQLGAGPEIPKWIEMPIFHFLQRMLIGHPERLGFDPIRHDLLDELPIGDRGLVEALRNRRIRLLTRDAQVRFVRYEGRPSIEYFIDYQIPGVRRGEIVWQPYHSEIDSVILATGYERRFDMLPEELRPSTDEPPLFHVFDRRERGLLYMSEVTVPQGAWPMYAEQAHLIASYLSAASSNSERAELWDSFRAQENPDFKAELFSAEGPYHVKPKLYQALLRSASAWLRGASLGDD